MNMGMDLNKSPTNFYGYKKKPKNSFDFDRSQDSQGEKKAQTKIFHLLNQMHLNPQVNTFKIPKIFENLPFMIQIILLLGMTYISVLFFFLIQNVISLIVSTVILVIFITILIILQHLSQKATFNNQKDLHPNSTQFQKRAFKQKKGPKKPKNIEISLKCSQHQELDLKMAILYIIIPYNSQIPHRIIKWRNIGKVIIFASYLLGILLYLIKQIIFSTHIHSFDSVFDSIFVSFLTGMMIFLIILFLVSEIWLFLTTSDNFVKLLHVKHDKGENILVALNLLQKLQNIDPRLKWVDLQIIFTGADHKIPFGSMAYFQKNVSELRKYHDRYFLRIEKPFDFNLKISKNHFIFNRNDKSEFSIKDLLQHLSLQHHISYSVKHGFLEKITHSFYPKPTQDFFQDLVVMGKNPFQMKSKPMEKSHEAKDYPLEKLGDIFYHFILTLDKRITDKINSGE